MIRELHDKQANEISRLKKRWLETFAEPVKADRIAAASAILRQYDAMSSTYKPRILFADGPRLAMSMLCHLLGVNEHPDKEFLPEIPFGFYGDARNIGDEMFLTHVTEANRIKQQFNASFSQEVAGSLRNMILFDLNHRIVAQVFQPVLKSLESFQPEYLKGFRFRPSLYPSCLDADWSRFYKLCDTCFDMNLVGNSIALEFIDAGGFMVYAYDSFAILVPHPDLVLTNPLGQIHCEDGAAVLWNDGTGIYYWNGIEVPSVLIENPDAVKREDVIAEQNAEVRRCYLEILGSDRFGNLLGLQLLDHSKDQFGNDLKLFRTKDRDKVAGDFIYFGSVVCPSTLRSYFLCVPPHIKTALEAVSWTFGKTPANYKPDIET